MIEKLTVLVVDDTMLMRRIVSNILEEIGIKSIHEADSGTMALQVITKIPFDLILMDRKMPGMDGLDCLKEIRFSREYKEQRDLAVIMVTAESSKKDIEVGLNAGADDYITKPFELEDLKEKILAVVKKKGLDTKYKHKAASKYSGMSLKLT
ncbi:MAG: response regulator [Nitrospinae bacterium]|nr:response regulator [Nitrospinota bacterium]